MPEAQVIEGWNRELAEIDPARRDVYFTEEYVKLYQQGGVMARCFAYEEDGERYLVPFLEHPNKYLSGRYDIATPYGYGGPVSTSDDPDFLNRASAAMFCAMKERGAVSGLVRCHPLLDTHERLGEGWEVRRDRETVAADLAGTVDDLWNGQLSSKARNRIRRAQAAGVELSICTDFCKMREFQQVYYEAMDLVSANDFYYFGNEYFDAICDGFKGKAALICATLGGRLIAGNIVFLGGPLAHSHLSGSRADHRDIAPNDFVVFHSMLYAQRRGCKRIHYGGGVSSSPDDTLLRFKRRFTPDRFDFYVATAVFDRVAFDRAAAAAEAADAVRDGEDKWPPYGLFLPPSNSARQAVCV